MKSRKRQFGFLDDSDQPPKKKRSTMFFEAILLTFITGLFLGAELVHFFFFWWPRPFHGGHFITIVAIWILAAISGIQWFRWKMIEEDPVFPLFPKSPQ